MQVFALLEVAGWRGKGERDGGGVGAREFV